MSFQSAWKTRLEIKKNYAQYVLQKNEKNKTLLPEKNHNSLSDHAFLQLKKQPGSLL